MGVETTPRPGTSRVYPLAESWSDALDQQVTRLNLSTLQLDRFVKAQENFLSYFWISRKVCGFSGYGLPI